MAESIISQTSDLFWVNKGVIVVYVAALAYLLLYWNDKEYKKMVRILVVTSLLIFLIIYNPVFGKITLKMNMTNPAYYGRVFILVPQFEVLAGAVAIFVDRVCRGRRPAQIACVATVAILLAGFGTSPKDNGIFIKASNREKLNPIAVEVADLVKADFDLQVVGGMKSTDVDPTKLTPQTDRIYRPSIILQKELSTGRDDAGGGIESGIREYYSDGLVTKGYMNDTLYQKNKYTVETYRTYLESTYKDYGYVYFVLQDAPEVAAATEAVGGVLVGTTSQGVQVWRYHVPVSK